MWNINPVTHHTRALPAVVGLMLWLCLALALTLTASGAFAASTMTVYKSPDCGCCQKWIDHLQHGGFAVTGINTHDLNRVKHEHSIAPQYQSCHTGIVDGYVFEGHVPAAVIQRFLQQPPADAVGLSVPGMPIGSPGMEMGGRHDDYDVLLLKKDGSSEVYQRVTATTEGGQ